MITADLKEYLKKEFYDMNHKKYYKYFETWVSKLTESQIHYFRNLWQIRSKPFLDYPNSSEVIGAIIDSLDQFQKQRIYSHYLAKMLALKHNFIVNKGKFQYLWKDMHIESFLEFSSSSNYKVTDFGPDWKNMNVASRIRVDLLGIYDWYQKFRTEIKLN